jgi:hypothetical protein
MDALVPRAACPADAASPKQNNIHAGLWQGRAESSGGDQTPRWRRLLQAVPHLIAPRRRPRYASGPRLLSSFAATEKRGEEEEFRHSCQCRE